MKALEEQSSRTRALQRLGRVEAPDQWPEISRSIRRAGWMYFLKRYGLPAGVFGASAALVILSFMVFLPSPEKAHKAGSSEPGADRKISSSVVSRPVPGVSAVGIVKEAVESIDSGVAGQTQTVGKPLRPPADYSALETDHYDNMVGQFLDQGASLVAGKDNGE